MSKYPSTPSFGVPWPIQGQPSSAQYFPPHFNPIDDDDDDDDIIRDGRQVSQYLMQQNNAAFFQNTNLPSLNAAADSGIPRLRHDGEETYSFQRLPQPSTQQLLQDPSGGSHSPVPHNYTSNGPLQELASNIHNIQNISSIPGVEEGELSEGEFEDSPLKNTQIPMPRDYMAMDYGKQESYGSYHSVYNSTTREPVYLSKSDDEYSPSQPLTDAYGRSLDLHRQRSKSYSPQPAPVEPQLVTNHLSQARHPQPSHEYEDQYDPTVFSDWHVTPIKSLVDAHAEAQRAILNLFPLKVRFQDYVDEGIDPDVVQKQFEAIGLPITSTIDIGSKPVNLNGEEQKVRNARLLAEKTKNIPSSVLTSQTTTAKADKERMLRLKMEALQKSREQRAQKAASKVPLSSQTPNNVQSGISQLSSKDSLPQIPLQVTNNLGQDAQSIPGLFLSAGKTTPPQLYAALHTQVINSRKRPVASDFDSMLASTQHKRPFGQNRSDQPLVIDVSDDESDDDNDNGLNEEPVFDYPQLKEIPVDYSLLTNLPSMSNPLTLSDSPARKPFLASAVNTPPIQFQNKSFTSTPVDLHKKEMEIEEMKKRIAEAERRKKAKQTNSGSQTPARDDTKSSPLKTVASTSFLSTVEALIPENHLMDVTSQQINETEAEAERKRLRRAEIAANLPTVEAEVQKNQKRLDALKAEIAQLEDVVQRGLGQKQILADEMEKLGYEGNCQIEPPENMTQEDYSEAQIGRSPKLSDSAQLDRLPSSNYTGNLVLEIDDGDAEMDIDEEQSPTEDLSYAHNISPADELSIITSNPPAADVTADQKLDAIFSDTQMSTDGQMESHYAPDPNDLEPVSTISPDKFEDHTDANSDIYDPPGDVSIPLDSPPFSPAPPEIVGTSGLTGETDPELDVQFTAKFQDKSPALGVQFPSQKADGIEVEKLDSEFFYTKYESPLKYFRAYRFHPDFEKEVSGGFKSLTYSNNINVDKELCRFELAGGVCNDSSCEFQHFKDMGLADDTILVELGNSAGYSEEEKPRFVSGLRSVLQELRVNKTRDFETIASSIAAYRAQFLGDRSRVLTL